MKDMYQVNITASDNEHLAETILTIKVTDINDNSPVFEEVSYHCVLPGEFSSLYCPVTSAFLDYNLTIFLPETMDSLEIGTVVAKDKDTGENSRLSYTFLQNTPRYYIDSSTGRIYINNSAQQNNEDILLAVVATDHGKPNKSATASVRISAGASSDIKPFIGQDTYMYVLNIILTILSCIIIIMTLYLC